MEAVTLLLTFSGMVWYIIDRIKPLWSSVSWGKWITVGVSGLLCGLGTWSLNLNIFAALGFEPVLPAVAQYVITTIILMSGSSCVSEILEKFKVSK